MRTQTLCAISLLVSASLFNFSCKKESTPAIPNLERQSAASFLTAPGQLPDFNLNVNLKGADDSQGHIKFRQDIDPAKIIDLNIKVHNLLPDHEYLLQRAVDPINVVDGNCTSISWLTLGKGLTPQSILTDSEGKGEEDLWRDVTAIPSGSTFDIHFQVIDAVSLAVVLTGDCYQYMIR